MTDRLDEIAAILLLKRVKGFGPVRFREVYRRFSSFVRFLEAMNSAEVCGGVLEAAEGIVGKKVLPELLRLLESNLLQKCRREAEKMIAKAGEAGGRLVTFIDEDYPKRLYSTNQCVPILYTLGNTDILRGEFASAVVGTRRPSEWTVKRTKRLVEKLVDKGHVIVSGLALGVDALAHRTALDKGGKTIAVLGCGPDINYPSENAELQERIRKNGLIVSEYPFGARVTSLSLKKRNKIIVGLSDEVYITETSIHGGTMNSYFAAVEQKKPVKLFLPVSSVGGDFTGNLKIYCERRVSVERLKTSYEPSLSQLKRVELLLFDLDGTLWNSEGAAAAALLTLIREAGGKVSERKIRIMMMDKNPIEILKSMNLRVNRFWNIYRRNMHRVRLYSDSTSDILLQLVRTGRKVGVVTDLKGDIAMELLKRFNIYPVLSVFISPSQTSARKPNPTPILKAINTLSADVNRTIYIGDRDADIQAARNAGCLSGLAAWNRLISISEKPDFIFTDFADILTYTR